MDRKCYSLHYDDFVSRMVAMKTVTLRGKSILDKVEKKKVVKRVEEVVAWAGRPSTQ